MEYRKWERKEDIEIINAIKKRVKVWNVKRDPATDRDTIYDIYTILKDEGII